MGYLLNAFFLCAAGCVFFQNYSPAQLVRFLGGYVRGQGIVFEILDVIGIQHNAFVY